MILLCIVFGHRAANHAGSCSCHTKLWPRTLILCCSAKATRASASVEVIGVRLGPQGAELHRVFSDDQAVLLGQDPCESVVAEIGGADGASGEQAALAGVGFEGAAAVDGWLDGGLGGDEARAREQAARAACFRYSRRVIMAWLLRFV